MDHRLPTTPQMAQAFSELFVNRRAYTIQATRPHPEGGRHYYYRPKSKEGAPPPRAHARHGSPASRWRTHDRHLRHQSGQPAVQMDGD